MKIEHRRMVIEQLKGGTLVIHFPNHNSAVFVDWRKRTHGFFLHATVCDDLSKLRNQIDMEQKTVGKTAA